MKQQGTEFIYSF